MDNGNIGATILHAVQALTGKVDEQTELFKRLDKRIEANTTATRENKQEMIRLKRTPKRKQHTSNHNGGSGSLQKGMEPETGRATRKGWRKHKRSCPWDTLKSCASLCGPAVRHHGYSPPPG